MLYARCLSLENAADVLVDRASIIRTANRVLIHNMYSYKNTLGDVSLLGKNEKQVINQVTATSRKRIYSMYVCTNACMVGHEFIIIV